MTRLVKGYVRCSNYFSNEDRVDRRCIATCRKFHLPIYTKEVCEECDHYE